MINWLCQLLPRPETTAGRILLAGILMAAGFIVFLPVWVVGMAVMTILLVLRPVMMIGLGIVSIGGVFGSLWFAHAHAWLFAAEAALISLASAVVAMGYDALTGGFSDTYVVVRRSSWWNT